MKQEYDFSNGVRGRFFREDARFRLPAREEQPEWSGVSGGIGRFIVQEAQNSLKAYGAQPNLVNEHARLEQDTAQGGYAHRQLFELVQNSADALLTSKAGKSILVRLTDNFLYCADNGTPIDEEGVKGIMFDRMSSKRNTLAIGRFGRGFKSVLRVTDSPEFYSRSGSFRFDRSRSEAQISALTVAESYPVLRLPEPIDPRAEQAKDEDLRELMSWANNIVRLRLKPDVHEEISQQLQAFPPEFMLFADHVRYLTLEDGDGSRAFGLRRQDDALVLDADGSCALWRRFTHIHQLSADARADWHLGERSSDIELNWAVPIERLNQPGYFWAFFPTYTASLVAGILNAPWKTNEDRQNLLPGPYNAELIDAAAQMVADNLQSLTATDDPARHLDVLPRRHEAGDSELADQFRERLFTHLDGQAIVPDQDGHLRTVRGMFFPPYELISNSGAASLGHWVAYSKRPTNWLHHKALTRTRTSRIDAVETAQYAPVSSWLEALVKGEYGDDAVAASSAAIRAAAAFPNLKRLQARSLGRIILCSNMEWAFPDPDHLFLFDEDCGEESDLSTEARTHPKLASDPDTLSAMKMLGIKQPSSESRLRRAIRRVLACGGEASVETPYRAFWFAARSLPTETALSILKEDSNLKSKLRIRTMAGNWERLYSVLLPGEIVPGDGNGDDDAIVDMQFHGPDDKLLSKLGVGDAPRGDYDLSAEPCFLNFQQDCRTRFTSRPSAQKPHPNKLVFESSVGCGPLHVLTKLTDERRVSYTAALLSIDAAFSGWTMRHETQSHKYDDLPCESLSIWFLEKEGRVRSPSGNILSVSDAVGPHPKSAEALHALLSHPMGDRIREAFDLVEPTPEILGEGDAIPLIDIWPGLLGRIDSKKQQCKVISCEKITVMGESRECVFQSPDVYVTYGADDNPRNKLKLVLDELAVEVSSGVFEGVLRSKEAADIEEYRAEIRQGSESDAVRLLEAVGEEDLRLGLPNSLLAVLEKDGESLSGTEVAEAAIATFHTDALRQFRGSLDWLGPPAQWAGSARAVAFVHSLGFSSEWAGERGGRHPPFLEVEGRFRLPELHGYQKVVVGNLRRMLGVDSTGNSAQRGMVSLPTGSGKTRVAVQAIVEAMRDEALAGGVLWVADRKELCEQAVEAWRQVCSGIGPYEIRLRVSRMWENQPKPVPMSENHVIVATIQTLYARLSNQAGDYDFLRDFKLVVFDEAHRSVAPTFTSVMDEIGLTRRQGAEEPFLLGLTATPYRGYDEDETRWLVNRYGGNRLDKGAFKSDEAEHVIQELQSMGVLAQADHELIEGESLSLDDFKEDMPDSGSWRDLSWLPQSVEDRIAQSVERTERILDAYQAHIDPEWPTLIFATSVEHATTMAALLNRRGIISRAVNGGTEGATRRRIVEGFRRGEIKALVNYGVFREGFDAPKTRAIIAARPVYSPNLYFQMVGRGLRGPRNGGDERCLILNVSDNIENFDRSLAFSELDWLWA